MADAWYQKLLDMEAKLAAIQTSLSGGGTSGTQYTDGAAAPAHPIGNQIMFNNGGTETAVSAANPFPTSATVTPAANQRVNAQANDFLTGSIVDLLTLLNLAGTAGDANTVASLMGRLTKIRDLLSVHTDTFSASAPISAATTFGAIPLVSALAANSYATLPNASYQGTFLAQINVASAFVGTIGFYGLLPDGTTLQQINAHQRGTASNGNQSAINTGSALEQTWEGSIAAFKAIYAVCTAFTSGAASVQVGLTAANYAHAIINTVAQNLTLLNGTAPQLDGGSSNRLGTSLYIKKTTAGDTALTVGQALKADSIPVTLPSDAAIPVNVGTPTTETNASVGTSSSQVLAANASAKYRAFCNDSTGTIYLAFAGTAVVGKGIRLNALGGSILFDRYVPTGAVTAIATAASSNLTVTEG